MYEKRKKHIVEHRGLQRRTLQIEMHDEIFHFEVFKKFTKYKKIFSRSSVHIFDAILMFILKRFKTFKSVIKVHEHTHYYSVHNERPLSGLLTCLRYFIYF